LCPPDCKKSGPGHPICFVVIFEARLKIKKQEPILFEDSFSIPRSYDVKVPEEWRRHTTPGKFYPGECFERAYEFLNKIVRDKETGDLEKEVLFVYGTSIVSPDHCWVELPGRIVFDGVLQRFMRFPARQRNRTYEAWYKFTCGAIWLIRCRLPSSPGTLREGFLEPLGLQSAPKASAIIDHNEARDLLQARGLVAGPEA
jgi:hypothetical protein